MLFVVARPALPALDRLFAPVHPHRRRFARAVGAGNEGERRPQLARAVDGVDNRLERPRAFELGG